MSTNLFQTALSQLLGESRSTYLLDLLQIHPALLEPSKVLSRAQLAQLLNMTLFDGLLAYVPEAKVYAEEQFDLGRKIVFDHGALRTVAINMKELPKGNLAFRRILEPLGFRLSGEYPLDKIHMCGYVYTHEDFPEDIAQYFVSELYTQDFSLEFKKAVWNLVYESKDPLSRQARALLGKVSEKRELILEEAVALLEELPSCFDRQHDLPTLEQYQTYLSESAEMAWISTEGNAFNHATDRVEDLDQLERTEKQKGRAMKPKIEEGMNANIRQTAYRASVVERRFRSADGITERPVPGSFFEFIERGEVLDPLTGDTRMDLRFDSRNAQGIFKMTKACSSD